MQIFVFMMSYYLVKPLDCLIQHRCGIAMHYCLLGLLTNDVILIFIYSIVAGYFTYRPRSCWSCCCCLYMQAKLKEFYTENVMFNIMLLKRYSTIMLMHWSGMPEYLSSARKISSLSLSSLYDLRQPCMAVQLIKVFHQNALGVINIMEEGNLLVIFFTT